MCSMVLEKDDENGARTALEQNVPCKKRVRQLKKKHAICTSPADLASNADENNAPKQ